MLKWISTRDMSREDWLKARKQGVGGSDAAAIMEATKFASPLSVYLDKLDLVPEKPMTEAMQQGIDCEEVVAQRFARETGLKITKCYRMFRSEAYPFMQANIDRCVLGDGFIGLECKTTSAWNPTSFRDGDIQPNYYWQCQHYMAVTGAPYWYLAVMVFSTGFYIFRIQRNDEHIAELIRRETAFWDMVQRREPPLPTGVDADEQAVAQLSGTATIDSRITIDDMRGDLDTLQLLQTDAKKLDEKIRAIQQQLKLRMGAYTEADCGRFTVTYRPQETTRIDSKRLKAEAPETWRMYSTTTSSRVLRIKEA